MLKNVVGVKTQMNKINEKILAYLRKNFGNKTFLEVKNLNLKTSDVYGFNSIQILIQTDGNVVKYQPIFNNSKLIQK